MAAEELLSERRTVEKPFIVKLRAFVYAAMLARFSLFILLAGAALLFVDQGQDLLRKAHEEKAYGTLFGGGLLWALSIWYWARILLDIRFPNPPVSQSSLAWWRIHLPRILGSLAFVALAGGLASAEGAEAWGKITLLALEGGILYWAFNRRRGFMQQRARRFAKEAPEKSLLWVPDIDNSEDKFVSAWWWNDVKAAWFNPVAIVIGLFGLGMLVWALSNPLGMGSFVTDCLGANSLLLLFLWGATFLPLGSLITYIGSRNGIPLFGIIVIFALLFSLWNDNHSIRLLDAPRPRPTIDEALEGWAQKHHCTRDSCPPLVIVATAGGGIRAAYWTGTVLGRLDDGAAKKNKVLRDYLFAISGVSGGSVGAAVYRAMLGAVPPEMMTEKVQEVLAKDFLTPMSVGILYPDFVQRFMPTWGAWTFRDRAGIFEESLEQGFENVTGKPGLAASFVGLTAGDKEKNSWPALFLNATWAENGRRIVAAGYDMRGQPHFYADQIEFLQHDMRLSTAAHNSARFPYVSPPGSWILNTETPPLRQRMQDGGLFENFGAETAMEILHAAEKHFEGKYAFRPLVILISSDPRLPKSLEKPQIKKAANFAYEILTTPRTFEAVRNGRASEAAAQLEEWARNIRGGQFAYFRMCDGDANENPPLGWALSGKAQVNINGYLPERIGGDTSACQEDNLDELTKVLEAIAAHS